MNHIAFALEKCGPIISSEIQYQRDFGSAAPKQARPFVTLCRQSGSGAHAVAEKLAAFLGSRLPDETLPWKVFDQNLVRNVLAEHKLPKLLARFMAEDSASELEEIMDELLGTRPPMDFLVRHTAKTILHLAQRGNVILLGRGANIVTRALPGAVHVRLVASVNKRAENVRLARDVRKSMALQLIEAEDLGRRRYLKKYFGADADDPLLYHLTMNTDLVSYEEAACLIGEFVLAKNGLRRSKVSAVQTTSAGRQTRVFV